MIGPGTGVAPYRGFLQQRESQGATGRNWLVFGARHFGSEFLYQAEWQDAVKRGVLNRCDLAFSRDRSIAREYVQDRLRRVGKDLYSWLENGAYLYVCGDAEQMAHKEILQASMGIRPARHTVTRARHHQQIKILVRLDEGVDDLHGRCRIDVGVHLADEQHQTVLSELLERELGCEQGTERVAVRILVRRDEEAVVLLDQVGQRSPVYGHRGSRSGAGSNRCSRPCTFAARG